MLRLWREENGIKENPNTNVHDLISDYYKTEDKKPNEDSNSDLSLQDIEYVGDLYFHDNLVSRMQYDSHEYISGSPKAISRG